MRLRRGVAWAAAAGLLGVGGIVASEHSSTGTRRTAVSTPTPVAVWETTGDQSRLLAQEPGASFVSGGTPSVSSTPTKTAQTCVLLWCWGGTATSASASASITVDNTQRFQTMTGVGASITDSSAYVLMHDMSAGQRAAVMTQEFDPTRGIGLDVLREPVGANDFSTSNYTEDDLPAGQTDPTLSHFSIAHDLVNLIPAVRQAIAINPNIQIVATPWTAPAWMKTSGSLDGGSLIPADLGIYANYLVKYIQAYAAQGIRIAAVTMVNEPDDQQTSYPGMTMTESQEAALTPILGHDLASAGLKTQILGFDSDWSDASYATSLLGTPDVAKYLAGTAFHCYAGDPSAQVPIEAAYPTKSINETECSGTNAYPAFNTNLVVGTTSIISYIRDWSSTAVLWNVALDENFGPTNGGCGNCVPNVSVNSTTGAATYNVEQYVLGQFSRFVKPGAVRVASTSLGSGSIETVAFQNPDASNVLVAVNTDTTAETFTVGWSGRSFTYTIPAGAVQTFTWPG
ncbi:MAG TPA: glycoside hydrolase family 30 beta sandwich domain-containing protein [Solirubrobacteraceae bacterium]|jgi:glucosylceramidase|nr:glycoside hydrolase family 30 beta sandwich domain-containing protein [Solirubrobacteraceae bacterium]